MEQANNPADSSQEKPKIAATEEILYESTDYEAAASSALNLVMRGIEDTYGPSILIGTVGLWFGSHSAFRYCQEFGEFDQAVRSYDDIIIRRKDDRLYFTLIHSNGRHEMELRKIITDKYDYFDDRGFISAEEWDVLMKNSRPFGKI